MGMVLAGSETKKTSEALSRFALPLGTAFQIQDDIMGVLGNEKKMGKSAASDIAEGKRTLLVVKAKRSASKTQTSAMARILGNKHITRKDIEEFRNILKNTGALAYAQAVAMRQVAEGKKELAKLNMKKESINFLAGIAAYLETREY